MRWKWVDSDRLVSVYRDQWLAGDLASFDVYVRNIMSVMFISIEKKKTSVVDDEEVEDVVSDNEIFDDDEEELSDVSDTETESEESIDVSGQRLSSLRLSVHHTSSSANESSSVNASSLTSVSCDCNTQCKTTRCRCKAANVKCTQLCHLNNHTNCRRMN